MTKVIGLLGGVGAGKSTVAGMLKGLGASVHDADAAVRRAWEDPEVLREATALLGPDILDPSGAVDRTRVAARVFSDPEALKRLEAFLHPKVGRIRDAWMEAERAKGVEALVLDIPLLLEAGLASRCDVLLFVEASEAVREERLCRDRSWAAGEASRRQAFQQDLADKRSRAHTVIRNDGALEDTQRQVRTFWNQHLRTQDQDKGGVQR